MKTKTKKSASKKQLEKKLHLDRNRKAADDYYEKWSRDNQKSGAKQRKSA